MLRKLVKSFVAVGMLASLAVPMAASAHEHERWDDGDRSGWRAEREHERREAWARHERWEHRRWWRPQAYRYEVQVPAPVYYGPYGYR